MFVTFNKFYFGFHKHIVTHKCYFTAGRQPTGI